MRHHPIRLAAILALALACARPAAAADAIRVGKAVLTSYPMSIADLGKAKGFFAKYGVDPQITSFSGDARLQQAFAADSIDVGLGSGPAMAFEIKGSPVVAVACFAGPPATISVAVLTDSPIESVGQLKGKLLAISTTGSLTEWLVKRLSVAEGWGPNGIRMAALGAGAAMNGALFTHQIDAMMTGTENASILADRGQARILTGMERYAPDFITHVVFARKQLVATNPGLVARFLKGFFASMRFAEANKAATVAFLAPLLNEKPSVLDKVYDRETPMLIDDGHFDPKAVAVLKDSFIDMGILKTKPADDQLFTRQFTPVTP